MAGSIPSVALHELASITVTYNPDPVLLEKQLSSLRHVGRAIVVDNGSSAETLASTRAMLARLPWVRLEVSEANLGLAAGLNLGIALARSTPACRAVLLLDQDSGFDDDVPGRLLDALNALQADTGVLCCVGPALHDPVAGMDHGFHTIAGTWRWSRTFPQPGDKPVPVANLNGSGTTMLLDLVDRIGDLDAGMFIDHVDTEWSFRVSSRGFGLFGIPSARFDHRMGETGRRLWLGGWRVWPERSPQRHYYLFRNTVSLLSRDYVPRVWKAWAVVKMMLTAVVTVVIDRRRFMQLRMMYRGIRQGMERRKA